MMNEIGVNADNFAAYSPMLHDTVCEKLTFDYTTKKMILLLRYGKDITAVRRVIFNDVYAQQMISCDYWGPSPHIYTWEINNSGEGYLYKQVMTEIENMGYDSARIDNNTKCIEVKITFTSGDVLTVLCKSAAIKETHE